MIHTLRYGMTNTFLIEGTRGRLLLDTDYAGTLPAFFKALKSAGAAVRDTTYVMATHYHPDHMGLISELTDLGVKLLLMDVQAGAVHFSDAIFEREHRRVKPIDETRATVISCGESRAFLAELGIDGEIVPTPSHSADSVTLILDSGDAFVGDLEPESYLAGYEENEALKADWEAVRAHHPRRIHYAHAKS